MNTKRPSATTLRLFGILNCLQTNMCVVECFSHAVFCYKVEMLD